MKKAFVTGASGLLGHTLIDNLIINGYEVIALVHSAKIKDRERLTIVSGDITDCESFDKYLDSVDVIFHLAGVVTDWAPKESYYQVHVEGTKNILKAAHSHKIKKLIYISTLDIFAHEKFDVINESTPYTKSSIPYRHSKLIAHELVEKAASQGPISAIILCPSWIYGPGDKIFIAEIIKQLKTKSFAFISKKSNYTPLILADNLCKIMIELDKKEISTGSVTFLVSDINVRWNTLVETICDRIGVIKYPTISIPYFVAYFIGMLMEFYGKLLNKKERPLLTRTAVETVGHSIKIDTQKITDFLEYKPHTAFDKGLDDTIDSIISLDKKA